MAKVRCRGRAAPSPPPAPSPALLGSGPFGWAELGRGLEYDEGSFFVRWANAVENI